MIRIFGVQCMVPWTGVLRRGGHHMVFCDCTETLYQEQPKKKEGDLISLQE